MSGTQETQPPPEGKAMKVSLEIGGKEVEAREFQPGEVMVGRRPRNDIAIDGEGLKVVSGFHMRFFFEDGSWRAEDKDSTNGTYLNGEPLTTARVLRNGDLVELGRPRKVGSYRSVQLRVGVAGAPVIDDTRTADAPLSEFTLTHGGQAKAAPVPAADATKTPEEFARVMSTTHTPRSVPEKEALPVQDLAATTEPPEPSATPMPSADPVTPPAAAPAPVPAGELRALLEQIQAKSRRLGEISYRLDAHVAAMVTAVVDGHRGLNVADVEGGAEIVELVARRDAAAASVEGVAAEHAALQAAVEEELAPSEKVAADRQAEADSAKEAAASARDERDATAGAFRTAEAALRSALAESVGPVAEDVQAESSDEVTLAPRWVAWATALQGGVDAIESRKEELEALHTKAELAAAASVELAAAVETATALWTEAKDAAAALRESKSDAIAASESTLAEAQATLDEARVELEAAGKDFCLHVLEGDPGPLDSLAGMDDGRALFREAATLRAELAQLEGGAL